LTDPFLSGCVSEDDFDDELGVTTQGIEKLLKDKESSENSPPLTPPPKSANKPSPMPPIAEKASPVKSTPAPSPPSVVPTSPDPSPTKKANPFARKKSHDSPEPTQNQTGAEESTSSPVSNSKKSNPFSRKKTNQAPPSPATAPTPVPPIAPPAASFDVTGPLDSSDSLVNIGSVNRSVGRSEQTTEFAKVPEPREKVEPEEEEGDTSVSEEEDDEDDEEDAEEMTQSIHIDEAVSRKLITPSQYQALSTRDIIEIDPDNLPSLIRR